VGIGQINNKKMNSISIVIPVYNDEEVLDELLRRVHPIAESLSDDFEIVLIDDGSKDNSWHIMQELQKQYTNIVTVKLARNFGQQNSIAAGLDISSKDIIVLMDSDLQDRPEDIPLLINALESHNVSMAIAQWISREDNTLKKSVSRLFYKVSEKTTSIHIQPNLGIFRAIKREVVDELKKFPEKTATTISLLYFIGNNYVCVPLKRDARFAGSSGYNLQKMLSLTFARIFSFSMVPIRIVTITGFTIAIISFIVGVILIIRNLFGIVAPGWTSMIVLMLFLFGLTFAFLGVIGEYIGRIFLETKQRPKYIISSVVRDKN
jgi:dolichol-phosphate mannosyltransferase